MNTPRLALLRPFSLVAAAFVAAAPLSAADPVAVVVARDDTALRSGPAALHYPVATLKRETVLWSDGEESGFVRVSYPAGTRAFVKAEDVGGEVKVGESAKLQKPSRLRAANATAGDRGSWYPLLEKELAAGTEVRVLDVVKGDDGKPTMYAITAPVEARGWINKELVRRASPEEAARLTPAAPVGSMATSAAAPSGIATVGGTAVPPSGTLVPAGPGTSPQPEGTNGVPATTPASPAAPVAAPPPPPKPDPTKPLVEMYERVRQQPLNEAELEPAIAAFSAEIAKSDGRTAKYLQRFVDVMKIRLDLRGDLKNAAATRAAIEAQQATIAKQVADLDKNTIYKAIGRLLPSTVYDGIRLPKLYRLVTPEPGTARTIGYLQPDPALDLENKLNRVVGVIAESRIDESLRAMLLTPSRVDLLTITPTGTPAAEPPPAAPADPATTPDMNK